MSKLYDQEIYAILGKYGHKEPHFNLITELSNYVAQKEEQAHESGFTHANNDWAFKVDARLAKRLGVKQEPRYTATEVKNLVLNTMQEGINLKRPIDDWYWLSIASRVDGFTNQTP